MSSILAYLEIDFRAGHDFPLGALSIFTLLYRAEHATIVKQRDNDIVAFSRQSSSVSIAVLDLLGRSVTILKIHLKFLVLANRDLKMD